MPPEAVRGTAGADPPPAPRPFAEIPGPRGLALWRLLPELSRRPHEVLCELAQQYGDLVRLAFPREQTILVSNADYLEHVLHSRPQQYDKQTPRWQTLRQVWGDGLLTADGDVWRRQRQRMQPAFHQRGLENFTAIVIDEAQKMGGQWAESARTGTERDVVTDMLRCAVRAITRAAFGSDIEGHTDAAIAAVIDINKYVNPISPSNILNLPFAVRRWVSPGFGDYQRAMTMLRTLFRDIIDRRLRSGAQEADMLGMMMMSKDDELDQTMTTGQLYDEMMNILMAGHETTGIGTGWTWYWLSQNPEAERRLHAEIDTVLQGRSPTIDDYPRLQYTRMVFEEALRLTPPVWAYDRRAAADDCLGGYHVPKGTFIALSPYVMHHHPRYWDEPEAFRPERFTAAASANRPLYAYFPFSGGPRRCIGLRFAMVEAVMFLAILAQSFTVRIRPGHPVEPLPRLNLPPRYGLPMRIIAREEREPAADRGQTAAIG